MFRGKKWVLRKSVVTRFAALFLILAVLLCTPFSAGAATLGDLQANQNKLAQQQKENAAKLAALKKDQNNKQAYKDGLDAQITNVQAQIEGLTAQIAQLDADITRVSGEIDGKQTNINHDVAQLKDRLCALYMTGEASSLEIILKAESVMDLSDKMEIMNVITQHDSGMIVTLQSEMEAIAEQKRQIEANRETVAAAKTQMDAKRTELNALEQEAERVLVELKNDVAATSAEGKRISAAKKSADAAVDKWLKDYYAALNGQNNSGGYTSTGNFTWPCPGFTKINTNFKEVLFGSAHRGIDIGSTGGRAINGAKIVAADNGKVIKAGWNSSYGNCVYIDHGGGFITRYAHASKLACKEGNVVQKGQVIAYVGSTGNSTGPHLHFEVIKNGVLQNPFNYFKR